MGHLSYMLFIPDCPFNLISSCKLNHSLKCSITFSSGFSLYKDCSMGKTIETRYESQGLYYLNHHPFTVCGVYASPDILPRHLGHPILNKLKVLVPQLSHLKSLECETCQLGKHVRVSFSSSSDKRSISPLILFILMFGVLLLDIYIMSLSLMIFLNALGSLY